MFSGSAKNTLDVNEILEDLDVVQDHLGHAKVSHKIISKLKNTLLDRHGAEKLFNHLLAEYRADILPQVMSNWSELSNPERDQFTRMNNFFCGLHFLVDLADSAEATLSLWEMTHELPGCRNSSGTQRLIRTACKAFHARGSQLQAGCSSQFHAFLRSKELTRYH